MVKNSQPNFVIEKSAWSKNLVANVPQKIRYEQENLLFLI